MSSIRDYVMQHDLFCSHDHHYSYEDFDAQRSAFSFANIYDSTAESDMITADVPEAAHAVIDVARATALWPKIRTTGSARAVNLACQELFGMQFEPANFEAITGALRASFAGKTAAEVYDYFVIQKAQNVWTINDSEADFHRLVGLKPDQYPPSYRFTFRLDSLFYMTDARAIIELEGFTGCSISTLRDFSDALNTAIDKFKATGALAAVKIAMAYYCDLASDDPGYDRTEIAFSTIRGRNVADEQITENGGDWQLIWKRVAESEPARVLGGYVLHRLIERFRDEGLPIQIHTGYLAGHWMPQEASRASKLIPLFEKYRTARFDVFHASWPWTSELGAIAKNCPNVWPNMCWSWMANPSASVQALAEWLDGVPFNKIIAYGADTTWPWINVGASIQAKLGIARVLEDKIALGQFSQSTAEEVADHIMLKNGVELFKLKMPEE